MLCNSKDLEAIMIIFINKERNRKKEENRNDKSIEQGHAIAKIGCADIQKKKFSWKEPLGHNFKKSDPEKTFLFLFIYFSV